MFFLLLFVFVYAQDDVCFVNESTILQEVYEQFDTNYYLVDNNILYTFLYHPLSNPVSDYFGERILDLFFLLYGLISIVHDPPCQRFEIKINSEYFKMTIKEPLFGATFFKLESKTLDFLVTLLMFNIFSIFLYYQIYKCILEFCIDYVNNLKREMNKHI